MPNSIRTPRTGNTEHSRRIAEAVDNEEWQAFRVSLKGTNTSFKLDKLQAYYYEARHTAPCAKDMHDEYLRVDNYLKALARGGLVKLDGKFTDDFSHVSIVRE
jgi:hypothetical protein